MGETQAPDVADLTRRLEALEKERAILQTLYRYGHSIDYGLEKEWVDCFTEDGIFDGRNPDGSPRKVHGVGVAGLEAFITGHTRAPERYHKHLLVEPIITVNGDEADVVSYFVRLDNHEGQLVIWAFGRYRDHMVLCPDGVWRFKVRRVELEGAPPFRLARPGSGEKA